MKTFCLEVTPKKRHSWSLWEGAARLDGLQPSLKNVRQKFRQTAKLALNLDLVTKISQHNHFLYFRHHFGSTFPRNPTKPISRSFPTTPLMRWRCQHTCWWIWRFRGCHPHSPEGKKPNSWLQKNMVVYPPIAKRFWCFDDEFLKKKRRKYDLDCFLLPEFLGYWIL